MVHSACVTRCAVAVGVCLQAVEQHTEALSSWLYGQLSSLRHSNGAPLIQLYGRHDQQGQGTASASQAAGFGQGAVFNFQVLQADGQPVNFSSIDREATAAGIYLRSGCVCNPGVSVSSIPYVGRPCAHFASAATCSAFRAVSVVDCANACLLRWL
jgi:selenocysteine lyase/cysteine desulfurase